MSSAAAAAVEAARVVAEEAAEEVSHLEESTDLTGVVAEDETANADNSDHGEDVGPPEADALIVQRVFFLGGRHVWSCCHVAVGVGLLVRLGEHASEACHDCETT